MSGFLKTKGMQRKYEQPSIKLGRDEAYHAQQFEHLLRADVREGDAHPVMSDDRLNSILFYTLFGGDASR